MLAASHARILWVLRPQGYIRAIVASLFTVRMAFWLAHVVYFEVISLLGERPCFGNFETWRMLSVRSTNKSGSDLLMEQTLDLGGNCQDVLRPYTKEDSLQNSDSKQ